MTCSHQGCDARVMARGLCSKHYQRAQSRGELPNSWSRRQRQGRPFHEKLEHGKRVSDDGCWEWAGALSDHGYGRMPASRGRYVSVHRESYKIHCGEIPNGLDVDHLCRNRKCFNPDHLELVTRKENVRRGALPAMMREKSKAQTHCKNGHPLSGDNLILQGRDRKARACRKCRSIRQRRRYHERRSSTKNGAKSMPKTFTNVCAQGDVLFILRNDDTVIPATAVKVNPDVNGHIIVTMSETQHHHVVLIDKPKKDDPPNAEMFQSADNPLIAWLRVNRPTVLEHLRPHDTHAPILFQPGVYEVRRQREYVPEGFRRVAD